MRDHVRLAVVGAGLVGRRHVDAIRKADGAVLSAVVDPGEDGRDFARENGLVHFETLSQLVEAHPPEGIILATPTPLHVEQGLYCIEHGIPTLVEKPLAVSVDQAWRLVKAGDHCGVPLLVGHHRRHNPMIRKARELIEAGEIGEIRAVHASAWFYKPDWYFDVAPWRKKTGAGPISVNLVHDVDLIRHLCGEVVSVQAMANPAIRGFENEDVAAAVLRLENNAIGTITVSDAIVAPWSWELTAQEYPVYPRTSESCCMIGGSHASLSLPDLRLWSHGRERDWWTPISATSVIRGSSDPLVEQIGQFVEVIRGQASPLVSGLEGLKTLRVIEAIQDSAKTVREITIPSE